MWLQVGRDGRNLDMEEFRYFVGQKNLHQGRLVIKKWGRFITERCGILVDFFFFKKSHNQ